MTAITHRHDLAIMRAGISHSREETANTTTKTIVTTVTHLSQVRQSFFENAEDPRCHDYIAKFRRDTLMIALGMVDQERHGVVEPRRSSYHKEDDIDTALFNNGITNTGANT